MLLDEGKSRMPHHQRRIQFLKAKKASNERNGEWIERLLTLTEVAELENITADELGIHVFTESVDQTMTKLALEELAKVKPSLKQPTNSVKSTESSQWYTQHNLKGYSKAAAATHKQCGKCDDKGDTSEECWGQCSHCGKYNH